MKPRYYIFFLLIFAIFSSCSHGTYFSGKRMTTAPDGKKVSVRSRDMEIKSYDPRHVLLASHADVNGSISEFIDTVTDRVSKGEAVPAGAVELMETVIPVGAPNIKKVRHERRYERTYDRSYRVSPAAHYFSNNGRRGKDSEVANAMYGNAAPASLSRIPPARTTSVSPTQSNIKSNITGKDVINMAIKYQGTKYKWRGKDEVGGFDCSGFTAQVYKDLGINDLNGKNSNGQRSVGDSVSVSNLQPGDLVFFQGHVAIYMGEGMIIHSSGSDGQVLVSYIQDVGRPIQEARRIIG